MSDEAREILTKLFQSAVAAAQPKICVPDHLPPMPKGDLIILSCGKAATAMARAALDHYSKQGVDLEKIKGFVTSRHGYDLDTKPLELIEAGHPVPDENSHNAAQRAYDMASNATEDDMVLVLLSGGGSALWSLPLPSITLEDKQQLTKELLRSGATIAEINCLRKHLSGIKGGRLAKAAYPARCLTLAISDVPGDDTSAIASGPTVADPTTQADALKICERYGINLKPSLQQILKDPANESVKPGSDQLANAEYKLVARPADSLTAAAKIAEDLGYKIIQLGDSLEGEARELAEEQATKAQSLAEKGQKCVLLSGGEVTVTIKGSGRGGPNQEFALALAHHLDGDPRIAAIVCDTDGTDGGSGAVSDPAGAMVLPDCLTKANKIGINSKNMLEENDSTGFFSAIDELVITGPTYTNVNDFRAILINF